MLALSAATKVYLAAGATDLRKGFDGLCALVEGVLEEAPLSGHVFLFANAPRTRLKVLVWDGSGLWCPATIGDSVTVLPGGRRGHQGAQRRRKYSCGLGWGISISRDSTPPLRRKDCTAVH
ncbi:MAG: IS66 family insertion sequence element accessory protein TnpB [Verrucomicrobiales bacterium]|nr:IS66 family insertion sequence element accessory protein TnpB [Verrucomicrobiales bacterium]